MRKLLFLVLTLVLFGTPGAFAQNDAPAPHAIATPALWTVHGRGGSLAYLFGSIHLVPQQMDWHAPNVVRAMQRSDTFVFEVLLNDATEHAVAAYIRDKGTLASGMSLRAMLTPQAQVDYDAALAQTGLRLEDVDTMRPWLASITFDLADMTRRNYDSGGVDKQIFTWAVRENKSIRALETIQQQLAILAPSGPKLEMEGFEVELRDLKNASASVGPLVDAWANGDIDAVERISTAELKKYPHVAKAVFADRNAKWARQIRALLTEPHIYFIVVGTAHLTGRSGVPALLRKAGLDVEGP